MPPIRQLAALAIAAASTVSGPAQAALDTAICSVAVDYSINGALSFAYRKDFSVQEGVPFNDDFSTPIRFRTFGALVRRTNGDLTVSIDYFNDVGVFVSVGFDTSLTIRGGGAGDSTSGSHSTYVSSGVTPGVVGGRHTTSYTLSCRKA